MQVVPGRFEAVDVDENQKCQVIVDRAHSPLELEMLIDEIRGWECQRLILVIGCDGDVTEHGRAQRKWIGELAHYRADVVIFTNASHRTEDPETIIQEMVDGLPAELYEDWAWCDVNLMVDPGRISPVRTAALFCLPLRFLSRPCSPLRCASALCLCAVPLRCALRSASALSRCALPLRSASALWLCACRCRADLLRQPVTGSARACAALRWPCPLQRRLRVGHSAGVA